MIQRPWLYPVATQQLAATHIQKIVRRFLTQLRLGLRRPYRRKPVSLCWCCRGVVCVAAASRRHFLQLFGRRGGRAAGAAAKPRGRKRPVTPRPRAALATRFLNWKATVVPGGVPVTDPMAGFDHWCIVRIQAWWRMVPVMAGFRLRRFALYHLAAMQVTSVLSFFWAPCGNFHPAALSVVRSKTSGEWPTRRCQRPSTLSTCLCPAFKGRFAACGALWRVCAGGVLCVPTSFLRPPCSDRLVYFHFRDMLLFRSSGDPVSMLRAINPREASLLDAASGSWGSWVGAAFFARTFGFTFVSVHLSGLRVRFRLGGTTFPPQVYYKLFTSAPVCDVNAFAPRVRSFPVASVAPSLVGVIHFSQPSGLHRPRFASPTPARRPAQQKQRSFWRTRDGWTRRRRRQGRCRRVRSPRRLVPSRRKQRLAVRVGESVGGRRKRRRRRCGLQKTRRVPLLQSPAP